MSTYDMDCGGCKKPSLWKDIVRFLLAALFAFFTAKLTYQAGVKHGVALTVASNYVKAVYSAGYNQGIDDAIKSR